MHSVDILLHSTHLRYLHLAEPSPETVEKEINVGVQSFWATSNLYGPVKSEPSTRMSAEISISLCHDLTTSRWQKPISL